MANPSLDKGNAELLRIGGQMASVMFNLAQRPGDALTGDHVATMDSLRKQWDAARATLASRPAEVDDEGLPPLPPEAARAMKGAGAFYVKWQEAGKDLRGALLLYTAEQYRQGQRDAVAADRARRGVGGKIPRESNDALIKLAKYWKLDGDWMTCRGCRRSLIASRDGEELNHGDGCKFWNQQHPWAQLRSLIAQRPALAESAP